MKVLICDYTGIAAQWIDENLFKENLEIVGTINPATDKKLLAENSWEYLLLFEQGARPFFMTLMQFMNIAPERVIFALDAGSWAMHPAAMYTLLKPSGGGLEAYRLLTFNTARQLNYFMSCTTADDLHYIATSKDDIILGTMYLKRKTWSEEDMKLFHSLAQKFYGIDDGEGLFLDLGANIGTTGVYFLKQLTPKLKLLAFEPDPENFKLLRANLILNDVYEKAVVENFGLGDKESEMTMYRAPLNPGANKLFADENNPKQESELIKIITLDKYFADKKISPKDVKYVWIDTEGFEPPILLGMKNILTENPAPIFMEFNPHVYKKSGYYEKMMKFLSELYVGYVWIQQNTPENQIIVNPIEKLWEYQNYPTQLGDIFLVHKLE